MLTRRRPDDYPTDGNYEKPPSGQYIVNTLKNNLTKLWSLKFGKDLAKAMNVPAASMPPMDLCLPNSGELILPTTLLQVLRGFEARSACGNAKSLLSHVPVI